MNPDVYVSSLVFRPDDMVEITYMESRDQGERAGLVRTLVVERTLFPEEFDDLVGDIQDLIDDTIVELRHPSPEVKRTSDGVEWTEPPLPFPAPSP